MNETTLERYDVQTPGCREKFETWIKERGGVIVWRNQDLSFPGRGDIFTPATTQDGSPGEKHKPHWAMGCHETVTDLARFRFVKSWTEVKRIKIALDSRLRGMKIMLTAASSRKLRATEAKLRSQYPEVGHHFEDLECVFETPEWED